MWFEEEGTIESPGLVIILVSSLLPWKLGLGEGKVRHQSQDETALQTAEKSASVLPALGLST